VRLRIFAADVAYRTRGDNEVFMRLAGFNNRVTISADPDPTGPDPRDRIRVRLHTTNPFAWVSAVRLALRRFQVDGAEIDRFTEEALRREEPAWMRDVCSAWASIEVVP
jgi:hypothetical protein